MSRGMIEQYTELRNRLRKHYENERTGEQTLYTEQLKLFKPIIETQKETAKNLEEKLVNTNQNISNQLVPINQNIVKRIDQLEALQSLPFYNTRLEIEPIPIDQATPIKKSETEYIVDLDGDLLNDTHKDNLSLMELDLPSIVQQKGNYEEVLNKIKTQNRSLGQFKSDITKAGKKALQKDKDIARSKKETLEIYKKKIEGLQGAKQFIKKTGEGEKLVKPKRGRGRPKIKPEIFQYKNNSELCQILDDLVTLSKNGDKSHDLHIKEILKEMLKLNLITDDCYKDLLKIIFK